MANKSPKLLKSDAAQSIRNEVLRFESVHPNIYAIYELLDHLDDTDVSEVIKDTIKEFVVSIEDSFVNSQEWTLPRYVNVLKLGIVGSVTSGKSALVHRYLTGSYIQDESPEGGRFKKEVILDGLSCLLLIRDEGGCPDKQLSLWADGVIFVFSLEKDESLNVVSDYYQHMSSFRSMTDVPILLVGTQDAISDSNPRVIDDTKARRTASNLGRAVYYETCATYGLNVERVFLDVCSRMLSGTARVPLACNIANNIRSRPTTPQVHMGNAQAVSPYPHGALTQPKRSCSISNDTNNNFTRTGSYVTSTSGQNYPGQPPTKEEEPMPPPLPARPDNMGPPVRANDTRTARTVPINNLKHADSIQNSIEYEAYLKSLPSPRSAPPTHQSFESIANHVYSEYNMLMSSSSFVSPPPAQPMSSPLELSINHRPEKSTASSADGIAKDPPTPGSTPTQNRKARRKSHLFKPHSDKDLVTEKNKHQMNGIGSGRLIPVKQSYLYKRSSNQINKDRKNRKYVTLTEDAKLTYYPNMNDYMNQVRGKEVDLKLTSIKIPGVPYRNSCLPTSPSSHPQPIPFQSAPQLSKPKPSLSQEIIGLSIVSDSMTRAYLIDQGISSVIDSSSNADSRYKDSSVRNKRHRRMKSNPKATNDEDQDSFEFILIGNDNTQWHFEAGTLEERDDWVMKIEALILHRLQIASINKKPCDFSISNQNGVAQQQDHFNDNGNGVNNNPSFPVGAVANLIRSIAGNEACSDCGSPDPCWASVNLGISVCIECSGVHRQLGTHLSRVRSFQLDDWSKEHIAVMQAIGNTLANSVWEASVHASSLQKPEADSSRAEKEAWVRAKYEQKMFLPPLPYLDAPIQQQLIDAITRQDTRQVILCLALAGDAVNACYSDQDPRTAIHIAATLGNIVYLQLLLWYNSNPDVTDNEGRNASFYAYFSGQVDCALFLLKNSCSPIPHPVMAAPVDDHPGNVQSRSQSSCLTMNPQQQQSFHSGGGTGGTGNHFSVGATLPRRRNNGGGGGEPVRSAQKAQALPPVSNSPVVITNHHGNSNNNNLSYGLMQQQQQQQQQMHDNIVHLSSGSMPAGSGAGTINNNYIDFSSNPVFHSNSNGSAPNNNAIPRGHTTLGAGYTRADNGGGGGGGGA